MSFQLRPYQSAAVDQIFDGRDRYRAPILVAPTGSGKTVMARAMIQRELDQSGSVLFLAPRRELVHQTVQKVVDLDPGLIMAGERPRLYARLQVASIWTLARRLKDERIALPLASLIIVDEAHLSISPSARRVLEPYRQAGTWIVGLTATPARMDGRALGQLYDHIVEAASVTALTESGYLVPFRYYAPTKPDLTGIATNTATRDFKTVQLADLMNRPKLVGDIVEHWLRLAEGRRTVVFASDIKHAIYLAHEFVAAGIAAEHVDARTPQDERDEIFDRFRRGETTVLCNVNLAAYGFDLPALSCVVLARPTRSTVLYLQMLGRGSRPAHVKSDCLVLDHAGAVHMHGFADQPRAWRLGGLMDMASTDKRDRVAQSAEMFTCPECSAVFRAVKCPECGYAIKPAGKAHRVVDGQLHAVNGEAQLDDAKAFYRECLGYAEQRGFKPGWAYYQFVGRYRREPPWQWRGLSPAPPSDATRRYLKHLAIRRAKSRSRRSAA